MGRWGDTIFEGDSAQDYFYGEFTHSALRELAYLLSPEQVNNTGRWLAEVFTVLELIILFNERYEGSSVEFNDIKTIQRWNGIILTVWEGTWNETPNENWMMTYPYDDPEFRKQHHFDLIAILDFMKNLGAYWMHDIPGEEMRPLFRDYELPHFSISYWINMTGETIPGIERFIRELMTSSVKNIVYMLSGEIHGDWVRTHLDEIWVAADMLGFLSINYKLTIGIKFSIVQNWRQSVIEICREVFDDDQGNLDENNLEYQGIMATFIRLEEAALKYPVWS